MANKSYSALCLFVCFLPAKDCNCRPGMWWCRPRRWSSPERHFRDIFWPGFRREVCRRGGYMWEDPFAWVWRFRHGKIFRWRSSYRRRCLCPQFDGPQLGKLHSRSLENSQTKVSNPPCPLFRNNWRKWTQWAVPYCWSYEPLYRYRAFPKSFGFYWVSNKDKGPEFYVSWGREINLISIIRMTPWARILFCSSSSKFLVRGKPKESGLNYCPKVLFWNLVNTSEDDAYPWIRRQLNYLHVWNGPCWEVLRLPAMYGSRSLSCIPWTRRTVAPFLSFDFLLWLTPSTLFRIRLSMKNFRNSGKLQQRPKSFERYINHSEMELILTIHYILGRRHHKLILGLWSNTNLGRNLLRWCTLQPTLLQ